MHHEQRARVVVVVVGAVVVRLFLLYEPQSYGLVQSNRRCVCAWMDMNGEGGAFTKQCDFELNDSCVCFVLRSTRIFVARHSTES
jgi:hypothetical protein